MWHTSCVTCSVGANGGEKKNMVKSYVFMDILSQVLEEKDEKE